MVRVVRLERTVSWSQTRRDTNFAIPGYSLFCHDTTAGKKIKDFSVCGQSCGQSRFCAVFCNRGKSSKRRCHKALRGFAFPCPGYRHGAPKNGGKTIEFRKYSPLAKATTALTEGVTPDGQALDVSAITATVSQYGGWIQLPDMLLLTAIDNNMVQATELLGDQAGRTLDTVTREVLNGGTNVQYYDGSVTSRAALTGANKLTVDCIFRAVRFLKTQNAKPIDGSFVGIIHPDVAYDLMRSTDWIDLQKYTNNVDHVFNGEIGKIAGVRFVETTEAKIFAKGGAKPSGSDNGIDVYSHTDSPSERPPRVSLGGLCNGVSLLRRDSHTPTPSPHRLHKRRSCLPPATRGSNQTPGSQIPPSSATTVRHGCPHLCHGFSD